MFVILHGWDYVGRNLSNDFHDQFIEFCEILLSPSFGLGQKWGNELQEKMTQKMHLNSSGVVRTIKRLYSVFGFIKPDVLRNNPICGGDSFLTERGKLVLELSKLDLGLRRNRLLGDDERKAALKHSHSLFEEVYCDVFKEMRIENNDGSSFSPLLATLRALKRYGKLDKWEWYLMNTFVRHDADPEEEENLDRYIRQYRAGGLVFSMKNVETNQKGHQYTPQHFDFAGLVLLTNSKDWEIVDSGRHLDIKDALLKGV